MPDRDEMERAEFPVPPLPSTWYDEHNRPHSISPVRCFACFQEGRRVWMEYAGKDPRTLGDQWHCNFGHGQYGRLPNGAPVVWKLVDNVWKCFDA